MHLNKKKGIGIWNCISFDFSSKSALLCIKEYLKWNFQLARQFSNCAWPTIVIWNAIAFHALNFCAFCELITKEFDKVAFVIANFIKNSRVSCVSQLIFYSFRFFTRTNQKYSRKIRNFSYCIKSLKCENGSKLCYWLSTFLAKKSQKNCIQCSQKKRLEFYVCFSYLQKLCWN